MARTEILRFAKDDDEGAQRAILSQRLAVCRSAEPDRENVRC